jgi:cell division protein FtsB
MIIGARQRRRLQQILGPVIAAAVVAYFAYYTVEGGRGLIALTRMQYDVQQAEARLAALKAEREELEARVASLRLDSLDIDRVDERARDLMNATRPDEVIVPLPGTPAGNSGPDNSGALRH